MISPNVAMRVLSFPPARGALSLLFLALVPIGLGGELGGAAQRIAFSGFAALLGTPIWAWTFAGFWSHVAWPGPEGTSVVIAARPRRLAVLLSWTALGAVIVGVPGAVAAGVLGSADQVILTFLAIAAAGLPVAALLPRLSRWHVIRGGTVSARRQGLEIRSPRQKGTRRLRYWRLEDLGGQVQVAEALPGRAGEHLAPGVRWCTGAREALQRWAIEGFDPTPEEVRRLGLDPAWSSDPRASKESPQARVLVIVALSWALLVCALLLAGLVYAVVTAPPPWWILLLAWAPALGVAILGQRLLRALHRCARAGDEPARITREGWEDLTHQQGLIRWEHVQRLEVRGHEVLLVATADAPGFRGPDLGNRMNDRLSEWGVATSAGTPRFGGSTGAVGPRHLTYAPHTGAALLLDRAARIGGTTVRRIPDTP
ncbi:hypothetical protein M3F63_06480 [Brachybacterium muris]|uniref:hypothetical protein n=1 Tax=Brachybacterium muris TaxID=219301 RepID=UPI00223BB199|nr:hypothetical protein [Brachybacterium muris]MCT2177312.1 hypothetical protein [Brachybacterium muris]